MAVETADKLLLSGAEAAALCSVSRSLWWSMHSAGKIPLPLKLNNRTLWSREELRDWIKMGCVSRERWEAIKGLKQ